MIDFFHIRKPAVALCTLLCSLTLAWATEDPASALAPGGTDADAPLAAQGSAFLAPGNEREPLRFLEASLRTNTEARALRMRLPPPRGLITDRHGRPMAQTRVVYRAAINFPFMRNASDAEILAYARRRFAIVNDLLDTEHDLDDEVVLRHYENRRWLPLPFTPVMEDEQLARLGVAAEALDSGGVFLFASYQRFYPMGQTAAHVLGNVGRVGWMPTGPIEIGDPLWENIEGRSGIELAYDESLRGTEGWLSQLFTAEGEKIAEQIEQPAVAGHSVVLTLDASMQERAEGILSRRARRGAIVVIDIESGDILVLASWPSFDPNLWVPSIRSEDWERLREDPDKPLLARAFQAAYPPASVFKVPVALAALESGTITANTLVSGPPSYAVGNRVFNNWNRDHEGQINVVRAMARSTNTWFYQVALRTGADPILDVAYKSGFGRLTGIPLQNENAGFVPDEAWARRVMGRDRIVGGSLANLAIGQGPLLATPLQMARAMAAYGKGTELPTVSLVRQVQDNGLAVVRRENNQPGEPTGFTLSHIDTLHETLDAVVNSGGGTARSAAISGSRLGGKTGTGQWIVARRQNVAWFCGIVPMDRPRYAFAILYEGQPGENVGGGRSAAPMASEFFGPLLEAEREAEESLLAEARSEAIAEALQLAESAARERAEREAEAGRDRVWSDDEDEAVRGVLDEIEVRPARPVFEPPPEPEPERRPGLLRRIFGGS